jgi:carbamoyltransferase
LFLGLNISHDASVGLTSSNGYVISAIAEERISRRKNHMGIPRRSLELILDSVDYAKIEKIIIGSNNSLPWEYAARMVHDLEGNPSSPEGLWRNLAPGASGKYKELFERNHGDPKELIENTLRELLPSDLKHAPFVWEKHHDSHLGCTLSNLTQGDNLLFSFDGEGDGESAAIGVKRKGSQGIKILQRIDRLDSLGMLYWAVTRRYNFIGGRHEGKITGLAAYGDNSRAVDVLLSHIKVKDGKVELIRAKSLKSKAVSLLFSQLGVSRKNFRTLTQIIDVAESQTVNYADLAFAVQEVLEKSMLEIVGYYAKTQNIYNISLAGGVFSNVKLNQKISELELIKDVRVFPNMGDGGIALGGIWSYLERENRLQTTALYDSMYLSPEKFESDKLEITEIEQDGQLKVTDISLEVFGLTVAKDIAEGRVVGLHDGRMEFGPRALGNRSILLDPRNETIVQTVNKKLRRTEFMPFAPAVLSNCFHEYFEISPTQSYQPFLYMTMTCKVKQSLQHFIPAVVHKDGTARPQICDQASNPLLYSILNSFFKLTGIPLVVNTSLNVHEEPINYKLCESVKLVKDKTLDVLYTGTKKITLNVS